MNDWAVIRKIGWPLFALIDSLVVAIYGMLPWMGMGPITENAPYTLFFIACFLINIVAALAIAVRVLFTKSAVAPLAVILLFPGLITLFFTVWLNYYGLMAFFLEAFTGIRLESLPIYY